MSVIEIKKFLNQQYENFYKWIYPIGTCIRRRITLYTTESSKNVDEAGKHFEEAIKKRKFGVLAVHNLKETMAKKGVDFDKECKIYEVCNPLQAKKVLEANMEISTALPCRISIFSEGNRTKLSTIRPTAMLSMYPNPELKEVAKEIEKIIIEAMDEAAG
ncbi:MAG: DUF302 domain-containing protein [Omnitrophica bacterium]|nr:DUF302 domain-containing protein [Candidatus Omnitrophota bacterium]